jgi:hypothetical protein
MKKGKAAKGIVGGFVAKAPPNEEGDVVEELRNRERELLKSLRGMDSQLQFPNYLFPTHLHYPNFPSLISVEPFLKFVTFHMGLGPFTVVFVIFIAATWAKFAHCFSAGLIVDEESIPCIWPKSVKVVGGTVIEAKAGKKSAPAKVKGKK